MKEANAYAETLVKVTKIQLVDDGVIVEGLTTKDAKIAKRAENAIKNAQRAITLLKRVV